MTTPVEARLLHALNALAQHVLGDHRLAAESQREQRSFFQAVDYEPTVPQRQRFLEWYLLEQESLVLGDVPFAVFGMEPFAAPLADSTAGLWVVETAHGELFEARDLQDDEIVELQAPSSALGVGDVVVGRLYQGERVGWQLSPAVAVYRQGHVIAAAFQKDMRRLGLDRRLSQAELEHLLLHRPPDAAPGIEAPATSVAPAATRPPEHIEAQLETVLAAGGWPNRATALSEALKAVIRPGLVLGPLLDQLAFDTKVDLDGARRLLLELWHAHHAGDLPVGEDEPEPGTAVAPGESLGEQLVHTLDAGISQHRDLGDLFRQLEQMAGIEPDEEDDALVAGDSVDEDMASPHPRGAGPPRAGTDRDAGDLDPLVTEFVWETAGSGGADERVLRTWVELQQNAALPHTWLDQVTGQDLLRLLLHEYLHAEPTRRAAAVQAAHAAIDRFSRWAESTQELSLETPLQQCRGPLLEHAERLQQAGLLLTGPTLPGAQQPGVLHVEEVTGAVLGVRTEDGNHLVAVPAAAATHLRAGDLLLGALAPSARQTRLSGIVVALPADAEALMS